MVTGQHAAHCSEDFGTPTLSSISLCRDRAVLSSGVLIRLLGEVSCRRKRIPATAALKQVSGGDRGQHPTRQRVRPHGTYAEEDAIALGAGDFACDLSWKRIH